jgi:hypothetical protein
MVTGCKGTLNGIINYQKDFLPQNSKRIRGPKPLVNDITISGDIFGAGGGNRTPTPEGTGF